VGVAQAQPKYQAKRAGRRIFQGYILGPKADMLNPALLRYHLQPSFLDHRSSPCLITPQPCNLSFSLQQSMSQQGGGADGLNMVHETQIEGAVLEVRRIADLDSSPHLPWEQRLEIARMTIATFDSTGFVQMPNRTTDRTFVVAALQGLAYHDEEGDGVADIAQWCMDQWLFLLQRNNEDLNALRG
jgi:hypothetical protein